jgi:hypothetical protein
VTRERDRYRRASWGEQLREAFLGFWRNRTARIVAAMFLAGTLVLRLLTPEVVPLSRLAAGDCVYLRPLGGSDLVATPLVAGTPSELEPYDQAERATCELSHSHEVSAVFPVGSAGESYPGLGALVAANAARCEPAFEVHVGRAIRGSRYATAIWLPNVNAWRNGARVGACLVLNANGSLLDHRAGGSRA